MSVTYDFAGWTAIVTGGARGIGRAIAMQLAQFGARVWIWDADPIKLEGVQSVKVNVTSADQIAQALEQVATASQRDRGDPRGFP